MINQTLVETSKLISTMLVSSGVSTIVGYAAKSSVPKIAPYTIRRIPAAVTVWKTFQKYAIPAGAVALAGMASEQAVHYADRKIDENVAMINQLEVNMKAYLDDLKKDSKKDDDKSK